MPLVTIMASISTPLSFLSTTTNVSAATSSFPLQTKRHRYPKSKRHISRVSCNGGDDNIISKGNRRDVLIGLGGLGAAASFTYNPFAVANPVVTDQNSCGRPNLPAGAKPIPCCPPKATNISDFVFPSNQPLRVRKPAHLVTGDELAKYKEAIRLMRALPDDDPRSFTQQANIHCAYCHDSYALDSTLPPQVKVHFNWLFAPFHRWYLYFYERILGSLIKDPTFALPFWNWDHPDGMDIPAIFTDRRSSLFDAKRNANHQPPVLVDLDWNRRGVDTSGEVEKNYAKVYKCIADVKGPACFFGSSFQAGGGVSSAAGSLETLHNTCHSWTGDPTDPNGEDMGSFYSSGRDPIFYCHHSNVDRLWTIWKEKFGGVDLSDTDYLKSSFLFYDENKNLVRVTSEQCLDQSKLRYTYMDVPIPWQNAKPKPATNKAQRAALTPTPLNPPNLPLVLNSITSFAVKRQFKSRSKEEKAEREESLVFEVAFDKSKDVKFDVLVFWKGDPTQATPKDREFAGSFVNVSHAPNAKDTTAKFIIGITDLLDDLEADDEDNVEVTLVPQYGVVPVTINNAYVSYDECSFKT
ncbi:hypothetical protein HN51_037198 [Arachis hypogaea]|uniref:Tyrosinase copper-binding domain-containing protein n=1 Tax=Arachis hypogaea TaxID=3818 RepID=A0A444ZWV1_ARAHY|nr:polyphenol oxidase A1, chloroplastic [Arachis hypogaea]RYR18657.1 hypothetical protein Ahy_B03g063277 [Arachis hypogaea]